MKCFFLSLCVGMRWWTLVWLKAHRTPRLSFWRWRSRGHYKKVAGPRGNKIMHIGAKHQLDSLPNLSLPRHQHLCLHSSLEPYHLHPLLPPPPPPHPPLPLRKHWPKKHVQSLLHTQRCLHFLYTFTGVSVSCFCTECTILNVIRVYRMVSFWLWMNLWGVTLHRSDWLADIWAQVPFVFIVFSCLFPLGFVKPT